MYPNFWPSLHSIFSMRISKKPLVFLWRDLTVYEKFEKSSPLSFTTTQHWIRWRPLIRQCFPHNLQCRLQLCAPEHPLSLLLVQQSHEGGGGDSQQSRSEDEPHMLFHSVHKPIIQEVREVISPYRRIVQGDQPRPGRDPEHCCQRYRSKKWWRRIWWRWICWWLIWWWRIWRQLRWYEPK